jgi:cell division transport system ATP-binding protein
MIEFDHISKSYPDTDTVVFKNFSAKIERGEFAVLTGESGSGKTTLLKLLLKEIEPDGGKIIVNGKDISKIKRRGIPGHRRNFGMVFQDFRLIKDISILENIKLAMRAADAPMGDYVSKIWNVARLLRITDILKQMPDEVSGGEQQKACIARAIINNPLILLADEPTSNLDPGYSREIMSLFETISRMGTTIVVATQDPIISESQSVRRIHIRK